MNGSIYYLQNPLTQEIFYIGHTKKTLKKRLWAHYQHLKEMQRGYRKTNRRYEYLINLQPNTAIIGLLEEVAEDVDFQEREKYYINMFKSINPNLTNMTDGGIGQNTYKYQTPEEKINIGNKLSQAGIGRIMPEGFAEKLSLARMGKDNPMAGKSKIDGPVICFRDNIPIRMFKYGYEVNSFIGSKYAWGNVFRVIYNNLNGSPYQYQWKLFKNCSKEIQDIVESTYESLLLTELQGSTFETCVVNVGNIELNWKNPEEKESMLYTAITRASKMVVLYNVR